MRVTYVAYIHRSGRALHAHIALQLFCVHRPGCGVQSDIGVGRHQNFVVDPSCFCSRAGKKVRKNNHAIAVLVSVNFYLIGTEEYLHHHYIARAGLHGDGTVLVVDGDAGLGANRKTVFFAGFVGGEGGHAYHQRQKGHSCSSLSAFHPDSPPSPSTAKLRLR